MSTTQKIREIILDMSRKIDTFPIPDIAKIITDYIFEAPRILIKNSNTDCLLSEAVVMGDKFILYVTNYHSINLWNWVENTIETHVKNSRGVIEHVKGLRNGCIAYTTKCFRDSFIEICTKDGQSCMTYNDCERRPFIETNQGFVFGTSSGLINIWNRSSIKSLIGHTNNVLSLIKLTNGHIASSSSDQTIRIWDLESMECVKIYATHDEYITKIIELQDGCIASSSLCSNTIEIWDKEGTCIKKIAVGTGENITRFKTLGKNCIGVVCWEESYNIIDVKSGENIRTFPCKYSQTNLVELDDGHIIMEDGSGLIKILNGENARFSDNTILYHCDDGYTHDILALENGYIAIITFRGDIKIFG